MSVVIWNDGADVPCWYAAIHTPLFDQLTPIPRIMVSRMDAVSSAGATSQIREMSHKGLESTELGKRCTALMGRIKELTKQQLTEAQWRKDHLLTSLSEAQDSISQLAVEMSAAAPTARGSYRRKLEDAQEGLAGIEKLLRIEDHYLTRDVA